MTAAGPRGPALGPSAAGQSAPSGGGADASRPRPCAAARLKSPRRAPGRRTAALAAGSLSDAKCHVPGCPARLRTHGQERRQRPQGRGEAGENEADTVSMPSLPQGSPYPCLALLLGTDLPSISAFDLSYLPSAPLQRNGRGRKKKEGKVSLLDRSRRCAFSV